MRPKWEVCGARLPRACSRACRVVCLDRKSGHWGCRAVVSVMLRSIPTNQVSSWRSSRRVRRGRARIGSVASLRSAAHPTGAWMLRAFRGSLQRNAGQVLCRTRLATAPTLTVRSAPTIRRATAHGRDHGVAHEPPFRAACPALGPRSQRGGGAGEALLMLMKPRPSRGRGGIIASVPTDLVRASEPIASAHRRLARGGLSCGP
jgi:hypothetical protein